MFKNKANGRNNLCGITIKKLRYSHEPYLSQRALASELQLCGLDVDKNAIQRIESGQRFVTDIEIVIIANYFGISLEQLLPYINDNSNHC